MENKDLKNTIDGFLLKALAKYIALNHIVLNYFLKFFNKNSKVQSILNSNILTLLLNGAFLAFIGIIFGGLLGKIASTLLFLNIISALATYIREAK